MKIVAWVIWVAAFLDLVVFSVDYHWKIIVGVVSVVALVILTVVDVWHIGATIDKEVARVLRDHPRQMSNFEIAQWINIARARRKDSRPPVGPREVRIVLARMARQPGGLAR